MIYNITWWNVENLFDLERSKNRPKWIKERLGNQLTGWTARVANRKVKNLVEILTLLNKNTGPDILGLCEVENEQILGRLTKALSKQLNRDYRFLSEEGHDSRGMDTAIVYDKKLFSTKETFSHTVLLRGGTRDIFQATFRTKNKREFIVIVNHWPARSLGVYETEPHRIIAAETLAYWFKRITEIKGPKVPVIVLGDFNDEPFDRSLRSTLNGHLDKRRAIRSRKGALLNLSASLIGKGASYYFGSSPRLFDQVLVSTGVLSGDQGIQLVEDSIKIEIVEKAVTGSYKKPVPFGRPSMRLNRNGYSDHLPVSLQIRELL